MKEVAMQMERRKKGLIKALEKFAEIISERDDSAIEKEAEKSWQRFQQETVLPILSQQGNIVIQRKEIATAAAGTSDLVTIEKTKIMEGEDEIAVRVEEGDNDNYDVWLDSNVSMSYKMTFANGIKKLDDVNIFGPLPISQVNKKKIKGWDKIILVPDKQGVSSQIQESQDQKKNEEAGGQNEQTQSVELKHPKIAFALALTSPDHYRKSMVVLHRQIKSIKREGLAWIEYKNNRIRIPPYAKGTELLSQTGLSLFGDLREENDSRKTGLVQGDKMGLAGRSMEVALALAASMEEEPAQEAPLLVVSAALQRKPGTDYFIDAQIACYCSSSEDIVLYDLIQKYETARLFKAWAFLVPERDARILSNYIKADCEFLPEIAKKSDHGTKIIGLKPDDMPKLAEIVGCDINNFLIIPKPSLKAEQKQEEPDDAIETKEEKSTDSILSIPSIPPKEAKNSKRISFAGYRAVGKTCFLYALQETLRKDSELQLSSKGINDVHKFSNVYSIIMRGDRPPPTSSSEVRFFDVSYKKKEKFLTEIMDYPGEDIALSKLNDETVEFIRKSDAMLLMIDPASVRDEVKVRDILGVFVYLLSEYMQIQRETYVCNLILTKMDTVITHQRQREYTSLFGTNKWKADISFEEMVKRVEKMYSEDAHRLEWFQKLVIPLLSQLKELFEKVLTYRKNSRLQFETFFTASLPVTGKPFGVKEPLAWCFDFFKQRWWP